MIEIKETDYTTRYDEVVTLIQKWHDDGASTEEILGIISTVKESVKYSFAIYLRDAIEKQKAEQNFCSRCGKRTNDIHTCTLPQENT